MEGTPPKKSSRRPSSSPGMKRNDLDRTYDRWTNRLVRSCWNFPYPWPDLGLLPFRICRRVSVAGTARFSPRAFRSGASATILRFGLCSLCRDWLGRRSALVWRLPVPSSGQAIEIQEDDRRGVERQELAQRQPANDGVAKRLAYLGAGSTAEHERHGAEHRRHRRHENRAETL